MEQRIINLIQAEIDGENSPEESRELNEILNTDLDARSLYDGLLQLKGQLSALKSEIKLPSLLSKQISEKVTVKSQLNNYTTNNLNNKKNEGVMSDSKQFLMGKRIAYFTAIAAAVLHTAHLVCTRIRNGNYARGHHGNCICHKQRLI